MSYVDGFVVPLDPAKEADYVAAARMGWDFFKRNGALSMVEALADDVPHGKRTDFYRAVDAGKDEAVVFSWIVWPDKPTRDAAMAAMQADPAFAEMGEMPFDMTRMIVGGFRPVFEEAA